MAKLLVLDGHSLTYRAFFALPTDLATASGQVTNAVYGFTSMLINLLRDHKPDAIVTAFDRPEKTFRHEVAPEYKAQREETPDILAPQFGLVREVLDALRIPIVEAAGYEADDLLASMATQARDRGDEVIVVTGDRDTYQLVEDPLVKVLYNRRGVSDYVLYDEAGILERTGVRPESYVEYAALRGDPSDNLDGVPGVGEKTAAKLINTYGGLDGVFEHVEEQSPKLRQNLAEHEERVRRNAVIMLLDREAPVPDLTDVRMAELDADEVIRLFDFLEFRSLYDRLQEALADQLPEVAAAGALEAEWSEPDAAEAVAVLEGLAAGEGAVAVAASWLNESDPSSLERLALVVDGEAAEVAVLTREVIEDGAVHKALDALLAARPIAGHRTKPLLRFFMREDLTVAELALDTVLAAYLLDPSDSRYALGELLTRFTGFELPDDAAASGQLDLDGDAAPPGQIAAREALAVDRLVEPITRSIDAQELRWLLDEVELPLVGVLGRMEEIGVGVDRDELVRLHDRLVSECEQHSAEIVRLAGHEFNVNSTKQLREVLFDELGLSPQKKTKTGFSTDAASLERLRDQHPIVEALLSYREVEKLRSTYGEGLLAVIAADGRIHATFNQTVARTGRLSSEDPNLHNIPVRTEVGRTFRRAFVPAPGYELLVADYNQIELRVIAHLAQDPGLIAAFEGRQDIHNATASRVFGVEPADVTVEMRSKAKMVSYGLAYGMEAYGLGQRLNIPTEEAAVILDAYFVAFPNVKSYMDRVVGEARDKGYAETAYGRRRPLPELQARNYRVRQAAERQAMNAPIQGLAADIFKVALVRLDRALTEAGAGGRLILQVHDEVIVEVPPAEHDAVAALTVETLQGAAELSVPLEVNIAFGASWADAKS
jgi:DNA polymerase I